MKPSSKRTDKHWAERCNHWNRYWIAGFALALASPFVWLGIYAWVCSFPIEERRDDGSFRPDDVGLWRRSDIRAAARAGGAGRIKLAIFSPFAFHVFDDRGKVYVVYFGEAGTEPPAHVVGVESYSGDPHKHPFRRYSVGP